MSSFLKNNFNGQFLMKTNSNYVLLYFLTITLNAFKTIYKSANIFGNFAIIKGHPCQYVNQLECKQDGTNTITAAGICFKGNS